MTACVENLVVEFVSFDFTNILSSISLVFIICTDDLMLRSHVVVINLVGWVPY